MNLSVSLIRHWLYSATTAVWLISHGATAAIIDDFESYSPGSFPSLIWMDVASVSPAPSPQVNAPVPSASIVTTTNAHGQSTQVMQTANTLGMAKGIFASVPLSANYSLYADMRTVQYANSDPSFVETVSDWSMQLTFAQAGADNFALTPQAGVYASSLTQGWRFYLYGTDGNVYEDIDLGIAAALDIWYSISLTSDVINGSFQTIITDTASGQILTDTTTVVDDWQPEFGAFDSVAFFAGETGARDTAVFGATTVPNIGQVDNVNIITSPVPVPGSLVFMVSGLLALTGFSRQHRSR